MTGQPGRSGGKREGAGRPPGGNGGRTEGAGVAVTRQNVDCTLGATTVPTGWATSALTRFPPLRPGCPVI